MKDKMTIGEYAKLRKLTTETLRHYDRIGLFSPIERDPDTGYRYYSIAQDEKLGTIRELQHLGMSIEEIKAYFSNRNLAQSYKLLKEVRLQLSDRIKVLQNLEATLDERVKHLEQLINHTDFESIIRKKLKARPFIHKNEYIKSDNEFSYASLELEKALNEPTPLLANNRLGIMLDQDESDPERGIPFIILNEVHSADPNYVHTIPAGEFACKYYKGDYRNILQEANKIKKWLIERNLKIAGPILQIVQIDISVTDRIEEGIFEIQIPFQNAENK